MEELMQHSNPEDFSDPIHPSRVFTLENALRKFREAGASARFCSHPSLYFGQRTSKWPAELTAFHYASDTVKWYRRLSFFCESL
jgi:hypothetical protein